MKLIELCNMLEIPYEVQEKILECEKNIDFNTMNEELAQMMHPEGWEGALERMKCQLESDEDGMKILTCQLKCACVVYDQYEKLGISKDIFIATMKFFTRFLRDHKDRHGCYRYVWAWWAVRQISMVEYRIGELEYEMKIVNGKRLIDLHIPADADLTMGKLRESYLEALDFFEKYYPDFIGSDMVCSSWLLAPSLKYVLPDNSRILQFQRWFDIDHTEDSLGFMDWVYGSRDIPIEELPEDTSLQRKLKPYLQNNGRIEWASGKLVSDPFCKVKENCMAKEIKKLTDAFSKNKEFRAVPEEYRIENEKKGIIESLRYHVPNLESGDTKHLNVYLPYCYNAADSNRRYNVLYLMHGGGEDENLLFGGPGENRELKNILDHMIANGDMEPLIVVTPTFYGVKNNLKNDPARSFVANVNHPLPIVETEYFHDELMNDIIPMIETKYHTYAASADKEDLKASREHRAFGGFSMGSVTTWYVYINCLDYFKYFIPLSGDCWALAQKAEGKMAKETAEYLAKVAEDAGYTPENYYLLCATGKQDIAYPNMKPQMDCMKELSDSFIYSSDTRNGNFYFIECEEGVHAWHWVNQYIYDILPDIFRN